MSDAYSKNIPFPEREVANKSEELETIALPEKIGPYKITHLLDRGGMSLLYVGTHPDMSEPIIVKVLSEKFVENTEVVSRFIAEADIIAMADHPNIVKLHSTGTWEKGLYIAMEYLHGVSLRPVIQKTSLSLKKALEIVLEIAYALCHLHTHHVIHRDLKPENIFLTYDGKVKVIDFGISQLLSNEQNSENIRNRFIGTPIYMSPEQRENPESVSYPSDIYSLGIITYELVLGRLSQGQLHLSLMPKGLQKILAKTLFPKPQDRYHDVVDFIADVSHYLHSDQIEREMRPQDILADNFDQLKSLSKKWLEPELPLWKSPQVKLSYDTYLSKTTLMWNYFETEDLRGMFLLESCSPSATTIMELSWLKGLLENRPELYSTPSFMFEFLNKKLLEKIESEPYLFAYISFNRKTNKAYFLSTGGIELLKISENSKHSFKTDHEVYLNHAPALGLSDELPMKFIEIALKQNDLFIFYPLPNHAEIILKGKNLQERVLLLKLIDPKKFEEHRPYLFELKYLLNE